MTAPDYAALIERLTLKNEDGTLCEITEDDQQEAADVIERLIAERDAAQGKYSELIYAVYNKYPGETRHQTAMRYITMAEQHKGAGNALAATEPKEKL